MSYIQEDVIQRARIGVATPDLGLDPQQTWAQRRIHWYFLRRARPPVEAPAGQVIRVPGAFFRWHTYPRLTVISGPSVPGGDAA